MSKTTETATRGATDAAIGSRGQAIVLIPCNSCINMDYSQMYCRYLHITMENGYAMQCHSRTCGGYQQNGKDECLP